MAVYLAFDVYGTLIDTAGVTTALEDLAGKRAADFARQWREKQLEYSFRRALMDRYADFSICIAQAFEYTCRRFSVSADAVQRDRLLALYRRLPAFADVAPGLAALGRLPLHLFAFSNGRRDDVQSLLEHAGISGHFEGVVSLLDIRTFKPHPAAYAYFLEAARVGGAEAWLVSSNPFDVIGALSAGMRAAWVRRSPETVFDPWEFKPTAVIPDIGGLARLFNDRTELA